MHIRRPQLEIRGINSWRGSQRLKETHSNNNKEINKMKLKTVILFFNEKEIFSEIM